MRGEMIAVNASIFRRPTSIFKYLIYFFSYIIFIEEIISYCYLWKTHIHYILHHAFGSH